MTRNVTVFISARDNSIESSDVEFILAVQNYMLWFSVGALSATLNEVYLKIGLGRQHFQNLFIGFYAHLMLLVLYTLDQKNKSQLLH